MRILVASVGGNEQVYIDVEMSTIESNNGSNNLISSVTANDN
jgi:hypothetical protein